MNRDLTKFNVGTYVLGKPRLYLYAWYGFFQVLLTSRWCPRNFRVKILRLFGSEVGSNVVIRRNVTVQFPWKLTIGDNSWIGEGVNFINHSHVTVGDNVCISQFAIVCSGSHSYKSIGLDYDNADIKIHDGAWICLGAKVLAGSEIGDNTVVSAGEIAYGFIPKNTILRKGKQYKIDPPSQ